MHIKRRTFIQSLACTLGAGYTTGVFAQALPDYAAPQAIDPYKLASDESFWAGVGRFYESTGSLVNLEHGYWGKMALPVQARYLELTRQVNAELSVYARRDYGKDAARITTRVAEALGVKASEIVLTRNATESIHNVIRQYRGLRPEAVLLYSDIDYPAFKQAMQWLADSQGLQAVKLDLPASITEADLLSIYTSAMDANPNLQLMLLTHVSNQHGLTLPVRAISEAARARGIDVICDCAQSWGLLDFTMPELNVDWAGFNLHKWIGAPLGVGALYMREGTLDKVAPYPGEVDADNTRIGTRIHSGTINFAAVLAVESALDFHRTMGPAAKEARLKYLNGLWREPVSRMSHVEVPGGLDAASRSGMGGVRLRGQGSVAQVNQLQQTLEKDFGLFTVMRDGLASGACIRITPQVFTTPEDMHRLVEALQQLG